MVVVGSVAGRSTVSCLRLSSLIEDGRCARCWNRNAGLTVASQATVNREMSERI